MLSTLRPRSKLFNPEPMVDFARDEARQVDFVAGCLLLIGRADWLALGGFDERYFLYGEDADLCLRATRGGRRCAITPEAVMVHAGGGSSVTIPARLELLLAGLITLVRSHWPGLRGRVGQALIVAGVLVRAVVARASARRGAHWQHIWRRRRNWWRGYPPQGAARQLPSASTGANHAANTEEM